MRTPLQATFVVLSAVGMVSGAMVTTALPEPEGPTDAVPLEISGEARNPTME